jgi:PucR C-terminal helix-turn-helix domain
MHAAPIFYADAIRPGLDSAAATAIEPVLPELAHEIVAAIQREVPEYARPLQGDFGRGILAGVEQALRRFLSPSASGDAESGGIYRALGRGEYRAGRSLDALQAAYRVGARVAWRRVSGLAADAGTPIGRQHELAETIFAYIDQLAAEAVEGYADAQAADAGSLQRRREELLTLLLAQPAAAAADLEPVAARAGWRLPRRLAMVAVPPDAASRVARRVSADALHATDEVHGYVAVPEPARLDDELAAAARRYGVPVGLGPTVPLTDAGRSWRWAVLAMQGATAGGVSEAEAHLADLLLAASPDIAAALRRRALAPLDDETPASRARLEATLAAWLRHRGAQAAIAAELKVHPQTVRYRMARVRELFGADLDDWDGRFALELALRPRPAAGP